MLNTSLNKFKRYQKGLTLNAIFPKIEGFCACGCGFTLEKRQKKWHSEICRTQAFIKFAILKGDNKILRQEVFKRDKGYCYLCGVFDEKWQADHIFPVKFGGSACEISNYQTLCLECHNIKSHTLSHRKAISSQATSICFNRAANALGAGSMCFLNTSNEKHKFRLPDPHLSTTLK